MARQHFRNISGREGSEERDHGISIVRPVQEERRNFMDNVNLESAREHRNYSIRKPAEHEPSPEYLAWQRQLDRINRKTHVKTPEELQAEERRRDIRNQVVFGIIRFLGATFRDAVLYVIAGSNYSVDVLDDGKVVRHYRFDGRQIQRDANAFPDSRDQVAQIEQKEDSHDEV